MCSHSILLYLIYKVRCRVGVLSEIPIMFTISVIDIYSSSRFIVTYLWVFCGPWLVLIFFSMIRFLISSLVWSGQSRHRQLSCSLIFSVSVRAWKRLSSTEFLSASINPPLIQVCCSCFVYILITMVIFLPCLGFIYNEVISFYIAPPVSSSEVW